MDAAGVAVVGELEIDQENGAAAMSGTHAIARARREAARSRWLGLCHLNGGPQTGEARAGASRGTERPRQGSSAQAAILHLPGLRNKFVTPGTQPVRA
jgi:hypothetical protein